MTVDDDKAVPPNDAYLAELIRIRIALEKLAKCVVPIDDETGEFLIKINAQ